MRKKISEIFLETERALDAYILIPDSLKSKIKYKTPHFATLVNAIRAAETNEIDAIQLIREWALNMDDEVNRLNNLLMDMKICEKP